MNDLLRGSAQEPRTSPPAERDNRPHGFDKPERPRALQESVGGSECARHGERQDKQRIAIFAGVADQHRRHGKQAERRKRRHAGSNSEARNSRVPDGPVTSSDICPSPGGTRTSNRRNLQHCRSASIMRAINSNVSSFGSNSKRYLRLGLDPLLALRCDPRESALFSDRSRGRTQRTHDRQVGHTGIVESSDMRRALFIAVLAILVSDASGITSLIVPEPCALETSDSTPDGGCPAFCLRCACPCCVSAVEHSVPIQISAQTVVVPAPAPSLQHLPTGVVHDVLHIPKIPLTQLARHS